VLNRIESTKFSQANTVVYTQEYPVTLTMDGIGKISRLNASCLLYYCSIPLLPTYWEAGADLGVCVRGGVNFLNQGQLNGTF